MGYKEEDDLVVLDGADESHHCNGHDQCATHCDADQDGHIGEVREGVGCYHQPDKEEADCLMVLEGKSVCVHGYGGGGCDMDVGGWVSWK